MKVADFAHHCPLCAWHRLATTPTVRPPACPQCGGLLRAVSAAHLERAREEDAPTAPARRRSDGTAIFALLMTLPWLLPQLGVRLGDIAFAMPLMVLVFAAARAAARARADERWASMWWSGAISASSFRTGAPSR